MAVFQSPSRVSNPLARSSFLISASVIALALSGGVAGAQVATFTGPGTDWNTASNWLGGVPAAPGLAQVILPTTSGIPATLSAFGSAGSLHIDGDNQVLVTTGGNLQVTNTISIGRDATGVPSLMRVQGGALVSVNDVFVGDGTGVGLLEVDGANSSVAAANRVVVGMNGGGSLDITNGGSVFANGSIENVTVTGPATIEIHDANSSLIAVGDVINRQNAFLINSGVTSSLNGQVFNAGSVTNGGMLIGGNGVTNSGIVDNAGGIIAALGGDIANTAGGSINNQSGAGILAFNGSFINNVGASVTNAGDISANDQVRNFGDLTNSGTVVGGNAVVNTGTLTSTTGFIGGGRVENSGIITNGPGSTLSSLSGDVVNMTGATLLNSGIVIAVNGNDIINQGQIANGGSIVATDEIVNSGLLNNNVNGLVIAQSGDITNSGTLNNQTGATVSTVVGDIVNAGTINNSGLVDSGAGIANNATFNNYGLVNGHDIANTGTLNNIAGGFVTASTGNITNTGLIDNRAGATISATAGNIVNTAGTIDNSGMMSAGGIVQNGAVLNNSGSVTASNGITNSGTVNNLAAGAAFQTVGGSITNTGTINNAAGALVSAQAGSIINNNTITNFGAVSAGAIVSNAGTLANAGSVTGGMGVTNTGTLTNNAGFVTATTGNVVNTGSLSNAAGATVRALAGDVGNQGGTINNGGTITAAAMVVNNATLNNAGTVTGGTGISNTVTINNAAGATIQATTGDVLNSAGAINNAGTIVAGALVRNSATLNNSGTVTGGTGVLNIGTLNNNGAGAVVQTTTGNVTNLGTTNNTGVIRALAGDVTVAAGSITNGGSISASGTFQNFSLLTNTGSVTAGTGITNGGVASNSGTYQTVSGDFTNTGTITNFNGGLVTAISGNVINNFNLTNFGGVNAGLLVQNSGNLINGNTVTGGTGVTNSGTLTNNAGFVTATTGNVVNTGTLNNSAGATVRALAGSILNNAGVLNSGGTLQASATINNAATLNSTGLVAAPTFINSNTASMSGQLITTTASNSGTFNITGNLFGTTGTFTNTGTTNLTGGNYSNVGVFNNNGAFNAAGVRSVGTATAFNNAGTVSMINGSTADRLTILGSYAGTAGSRVGVDIDLSQGNASTADRLIVQNGAGSGTSSLQFNITNTGRSVFANPIPVFVLLNGGNVNGLTGNLSGTDANGQSANQGFFTYTVQQVPAASGNYAVVSQFNSAPVQGVAAGLSGMVTALQAGFHQPASAIISRPDSCSPNQFMGGPFIRMNGGDSKISSNSVGSGGGLSFSGPSTSKSDFKGIQGGIDGGFCNVQGSGWNIHMGVMGGYVEVNSKGVSRTRDSFGTLLPVTTTSVKVEVPFLGLYAFVTKDNFVFEANIRKDYYRAKVTALDASTVYAGPNQRLKGESINYNFSGSYRFTFGESAYFEPSIGISKGSTTFDRLQFSTSNMDTMAFNRSESLLGRLGFNAGFTVLATDRLAVVPFLHASIWHEFAGANRAVATIGSMAQTFEVRTDRVGTFGQVGGGIQFKVLNSPFLGFLRGDVRFGDKIDGKAVNAGLRMQF